MLFMLLGEFCRERRGGEFLGSVSCLFGWEKGFLRGFRGGIGWVLLRRRYGIYIYFWKFIYVI